MPASIKLDSKESQLAIDSSIRTQAPIVIESPAFSHTTINGFLISGDQSALLMEVTGRPEVNFDDLIDVQCECQIYTHRRYRFTSTITVVQKWGKSRSIAIARPKRVSILDRRRFLRGQLAPSSEVTLQWRHKGKDQRCVVSLLNISADGIACRMDDAVSERIQKKDTLQVTFRLPGADKRLDLKARVTNKTPGSDGFTIFGLQFSATENDASVIAALRISIEGGKGVPADSEVCV